jgi:hypothetical protein
MGKILLVSLDLRDLPTESSTNDSYIIFLVHHSYTFFRSLLVFSKYLRRQENSTNKFLFKLCVQRFQRFYLVFPGESVWTTKMVKTLANIIDIHRKNPNRAEWWAKPAGTERGETDRDFGRDIRTGWKGSENVCSLRHAR